MLQWVGDNVFVEVRQDAVPGKGKRRVAALQYVIQNRSLQRVTVRLDFSLSRQVGLVVPDAYGGHQLDDVSPNDNDKASSMVLDVVVGPLQRRHVVHVVRANGERAFVRVEYSIVSAVEIYPTAVPEAHVQQWLAQSAAAFSSVVIPTRAANGVSSARAYDVEVARWCADVNRWSRQRHVRFVDPTFPPMVGSLRGGDAITHVNTTLPVTWAHVGNMVDASWRFVELRRDGSEMEKQAATWSMGGTIMDQDNWVCAIDVLHADAVWWCREWFDDRVLDGLKKKLAQLSERSVVGVRLSPAGREWTPMVIDLFVPVVASIDGEGGGSVSAWPHSGEVYPVLLQKAYAKLRGSYAAISTVPTRQILQELTGRPIVQIFPGGAWDAPEALVQNLKSALSHQESRRRHTVPTPIRMVSFGALDDHHCAFQLLAVIPTPPNSACGIRIRDPVGNLHRIASAKLGIPLAFEEEDRICVLPEDSFVKLSPVVFELLVNHSHAWRRRKIRARQSLDRENVPFQVAISCGSLQNLVVRCYAKGLSRGSCDVTVAVDRVGDDDTWRRLELKSALDGKGTNVLSTDVCWTATPGEYVVSMSMKPVSASPEASPCETLLVEENIHANIDLLFKTLDQDMDGFVDRTELVGFMDSLEEISAYDSPELLEVVDSFLRKHSTETTTMQGLSKDDLLQLYETVAANGSSSLSTKASLDDRLAKLIWNDLNVLLRYEPDHYASSPSILPLDDVYETCCVVSSDRDDVVIASLS